MSDNFDDLMRRMLNEKDPEEKKRLAEELTEKHLPKFEPGVPFYNKEGDMVEVYLSNEEHYLGKRLDNILTVMIGEKSGDIVGYNIKNISSLFERVKDERVIPHRMD